MQIANPHQLGIGSQGYFFAMKYGTFLLGNTSSGIIEAASFGKYVINLGNRQQGRKQSMNCFNVPFNKELILQTVQKIENSPDIYKRKYLLQRKRGTYNLLNPEE